MDKGKLLNFISKYSLNGLCNTVKWTSKSRGLMTNFISEDKSTLGMVAVKGINFPEGKFGIYNTKALQKIIGALQQTEITIDVSANSLELKDDVVSAKFMLGNLDIIADPPQTQDLPDPDFEFEINSIFIDRFLKSKAALEDANNFAFLNIDGKINISINYAEHATDRINIPIEAEFDLDTPLVFNAEIFKEVLTANKDATSGSIKVSAQGIMQCHFQLEDIAAKYYLVMLES